MPESSALKEKKELETEVNEAQIAVHWKEETYYHPSAKFIGQANLTDPAVMERFSLERFPECVKEDGDMLDWDQYWRTTLDTSDAPFWKWFVCGKLNACYNCVDRHLAKYKNKAAFIFVGEPEEEPPLAITYQELYVRVNEMAALLRDFAGLKTGDRVTIHMPVVPELPITMLACARLGIIHSVVFGGFSPESLRDRINDAKAKLVVTADGGYRRGQIVPLKRNTDQAIAECPSIEKSEQRGAGKEFGQRCEVEDRIGARGPATWNVLPERGLTNHNALRAHVEHGATRHEHEQQGAGAKKRGHVGRRLEHLLTPEICAQPGGGRRRLPSGGSEAHVRHY